MINTVSSQDIILSKIDPSHLANFEPQLITLLANISEQYVIQDRYMDQTVVIYFTSHDKVDFRDIFKIKYSENLYSIMVFKFVGIPFNAILRDNNPDNFALFERINPAELFFATSKAWEFMSNLNKAQE